MSKKNLLFATSILASCIIFCFIAPGLLPFTLCAYVFAIVLYYLNRKAVISLQVQKEPFKNGGSVRNIKYLMIGDMIDPSSVVPPNCSYVQIKAPGRGKKASFEILKHTFSILDEDDGIVIITAKKNAVDSFTVFDYPFFHELTFNRYHIECPHLFLRFPLLKYPLATIQLALNHYQNGWKETVCSDSELNKFCRQRNIKLRFYER